jgi:hypothetical protein
MPECTFLPGGGGGGAPVSDPTKVNVAGDTMTGTLTATGTPVMVISDSTHTNTVPITIDGSGRVHFAGHVMIDGSVNGQNFADPNGYSIFDPVAGTIDLYNPAVSAAFVGLRTSAVENRLEIDVNGDLFVTQTQGPNIGKKVNLTVGKWA